VQQPAVAELDREVVLGVEGGPLVRLGRVHALAVLGLVDQHPRPEAQPVDVELARLRGLVPGVDQGPAGRVAVEFRGAGDDLLAHLRKSLQSPIAYMPVRRMRA
jgi:hypothetical protein